MVVLHLFIRTILSNSKSFLSVRTTSFLSRRLMRMSTADVANPSMMVTTSASDRDKYIPASSIVRAKFTREIQLLALKIPAAKCSIYLKEFKDYSFDRPKMKRIFSIDGTTTEKLFLLREGITDLDSQLPEQLVKLNSEIGGVAQPYSISIGYDHLGVHEVLKILLTAPEDEGYFDPVPTQLLAENRKNFPRVHTNNSDNVCVPHGTAMDIPSSYEQIGHIAHLNLRDEQFIYKYVVGQVILDKNKPAIKTVINKTSSINNEFRVFPSELIGGEPNYNVHVNQGGIRFEFDFTTVYWNSRLQTEHERMVGLVCSFNTEYKAESAHEHPINKRIKLNSEEATPATRPVPPKLIVADMMCGVGPFAIPLALQKSSVLHSVMANDLNPSSYKALLKNSGINKCRLDIDTDAEMKRNKSRGLSTLSCFNMDGRAFIRRLDGHGKGITKEPVVPYTDVLMNLPASATEFLDVFIGRNAAPDAITTTGSIVLPRIHVYAFSSTSDPITDVINRVCRTMQMGTPDTITPIDGADGANADVSGTVTPLGRIVIHDVDRKKPLMRDCMMHLIHDTVMDASADVATMTPRENAYCLSHIVRDVAPKKVMICLSFILPFSVVKNVAASATV